MESKILELTNILEEIASLLKAYNQQNWKEAVRAIKLRLQDSDISALKDYLGYFRGMGSLNDITFYDTTKDGKRLFNKNNSQKYYSLSSRSFSLAKEIKQSIEEGY